MQKRVSIVQAMGRSPYPGCGGSSGRAGPGRGRLCQAGLIWAVLGSTGLALAPVARAQNPGTEQEAGPQQEAGAQAAPQKFFIAAIDVSGATQLSASEIERLIYPFLGPDRSEEDVLAAQKALQEAYAAKGFDAVLVDVPIQPHDTFQQGIVQLVVNESPVGRVRVVGSQHHSLSVVRAQVPSLTEGAPLNLALLEKDITAANQHPDRQVMPRFQPGQVPGTIDVDLEVEDSHPLHASVDLNNDNSPNTEALRLTATLRYTDLWHQGHTASFTYAVAPEDGSESTVYSGSYTAPLIGTPWTLLLYGYHSNSNVAALGGTNVLGNGTQIGLKALYRLPSTTTFQQISFGADFKDFKESIYLGEEALRPTPIRYVPLVLEYTLAGATDTSSYGLTLGATAGLRVVKRQTCVDLGDVQIPDQAATCALPGGGVGVPEDQFQSRAIDARENFFRLNLDSHYTRGIGRDFNLALRLAGQLADSSLVTNEQFSMGGMSTVRGYYVSEAVGDDGILGSIEIQLPDLAFLLGKSAEEVRFFTFADAGYARVRRPALEQKSSFTLASLGGGLRFRLFRHLSGEVLIGVPLKDGPSSDQGDPRYSFTVKGEF